MPKTREERYAEWLERWEITVGDITSIEQLQSMLEAELGFSNQAMITALWNAKQQSLTLSDIGIRAVPVKYPWGVELRYGVQGLPGLWGYESIRQIMREELG